MVSFLMLAIPLLYVVGALVPAKLAGSQRLRIMRGCASAALAAAVLALAAGLVWGIQHQPEMAWLSSTRLSLVMLCLVGFIGLVIQRYSERYFDGEPGRERYDRTFMLALASVAVVLVADHMLLLLAGWVAISVCLHTLLKFYPDRPRAVLAAHKKFLFARLAELMLLGAFIILYVQQGSWSISHIVATYPSGHLNVWQHLAAFLLASAAMVKCAQMPMHGWLMQVVEAPTPVSALLHAGIVNLGGYLLILFAPVWMSSEIVQTIVLVVSGVTVVLAALSMAVRVSIKVKLAWSTCAQMGLMLIECGLGMFQLALLHLLAHSCYKAHAFLKSGSAVEAFREAEYAPYRLPSVWVWGVAGLWAACVTAAGMAVSEAWLPLSPWLLLGVAVTVMTAERRSSLVSGSLWRFIGLSVIMVAVYVGLKHVSAWLLELPHMPVNPVADIWVGAMVLALLAGHLVLRHAAQSPSWRAIERGFYAGLYLDEWATRLTLAIWPVSLPTRPHPKQPGGYTPALESQS